MDYDFEAQALANAYYQAHLLLDDTRTLDETFA